MPENLFELVNHWQRKFDEAEARAITAERKLDEAIEHRGDALALHADAIVQIKSLESRLDEMSKRCESNFLWGKSLVAEINALQSRLDFYRQALLEIVEHYHYPDGVNQPAYSIANKALNISTAVERRAPDCGHAQSHPDCPACYPPPSE